MYTNKGNNNKVWYQQFKAEQEYLKLHPDKKFSCKRRRYLVEFGIRKGTQFKVTRTVFKAIKEEMPQPLEGEELISVTLLWSDR